MPEQTKLFFWNNQNLFSNNYLEHRLPTTSLWKEQKEKIEHTDNLIDRIVYKVYELTDGEIKIVERFII